MLCHFVLLSKSSKLVFKYEIAELILRYLEGTGVNVPIVPFKLAIAALFIIGN
jgi:hypothetical protein